MTLRAITLVVVATAAVQTPVRDAPSRPRTGTGKVTGTVVAGAPAESEPARRARVMLEDVDGFQDGRTATTDDTGRFEFPDLPAGRFTVEVYKPGYLSASYGASRPERAGTPVTVTNGGVVSGLTVRLARGAAISGTIRDSRGRPVPRVSVSPLRYGYSTTGDRRLLSPRGSVTTDDRGVYRAWGLPPGEYLVMAVPGALGFPTGVTGFQVLTPELVDRALAPSGTSAGDARANYSPVYFPGTADPAQAAMLSVATGEEREGVDLTITLVPTFDVGGAVRMPDGAVPPATTVTLTRVGEIESLLTMSAGVRPSSTRLDSAGRFVFRDVPPGTYTVMAKTQPPGAGRGAAASTTPPPPLMWAASTVSMNGASADLLLQLAPAMTISGRFLFDGASRPPVDMTALHILLTPRGSGGDLNAGPQGGQPNADGAFTFVGVTPGDYRMVHVSRGRSFDAWWLGSASANGREALDAPLKIAPGENVDLVLTFSDRTTQLTGVFQDATGRPAPDYFIVVLPADRTYWTPGSRRITSTRPGNDGTFSVRGLPPGEYLVAALTDLEPDDLNTRSVLEELAKTSARVTLVDGQVTRQDLTMK